MDKYHTVCFACNSHLMYLEEGFDYEGQPTKVCPMCGAPVTADNVDQKQFEEWSKGLKQNV